MAESAPPRNPGSKRKRSGRGKLSRTIHSAAWRYGDMYWDSLQRVSLCVIFIQASCLIFVHWLLQSSAASSSLGHKFFMAAPSSSTDTFDTYFTAPISSPDSDKECCGAFNTACAASIPIPDSDKELISAFNVACAAPTPSPDTDKELISAFNIACAAPSPGPPSDKECKQQKKKKGKQEKKAKQAKALIEKAKAKQSKAKQAKQAKDKQRKKPV